MPILEPTRLVLLFFFSPKLINIKLKPSLQESSLLLQNINIAIEYKDKASTPTLPIPLGENLDFQLVI